MLPKPARLSWSITASAAQLHIVHDDLDVATLYRHDQRLIATEGTVRVLRGLTSSLGVDVAVPYRMVRDRIAYRTPDGAGYTPADPEQHHRNETVAGLGDPRVGLLFTRTQAPWTALAGVGLSVPLGRNEANPFQRARDGLRHQHVQLGTGMWDPQLQLTVLHAVGAWTGAAHGSVRASLHENAHGFRAGTRIGLGVSATRTTQTGSAATLGMDFAHETAEHWDGRIEDEGNLGRRDAFATLGLATKTPGGWTAGLHARLPIWSDVDGAQTDLPVALVLRLSR